jgi:hypothetical protein
MADLTNIHCRIRVFNTNDIALFTLFTLEFGFPELLAAFLFTLASKVDVMLLVLGLTADL